MGGLLLLAGGGEDHLEGSSGRGAVGDRGFLRGVPQTEDQGLRPLFPRKERLGQLEEVALDFRLAPQPHHERMFLAEPTHWFLKTTSKHNKIKSVEK